MKKRIYKRTLILLLIPFLLSNSPAPKNYYEIYFDYTDFKINSITLNEDDIEIEIYNEGDYFISYSSDYYVHSSLNITFNNIGTYYFYDYDSVYFIAPKETKTLSFKNEFNEEEKEYINLKNIESYKFNEVYEFEKIEYSSFSLSTSSFNNNLTTFNYSYSFNDNLTLLYVVINYKDNFTSYYINKDIKKDKVYEDSFILNDNLTINNIKDNLNITFFKKSKDPYYDNNTLNKVAISILLVIGLLIIFVISLLILLIVFLTKSLKNKKLKY